ncbi:DgyrCDS5722 [Dimorphilus gyrociliatus]|uniref:DgyrCDS5722 n=1 Tax=Dimorphilus gyrociliatus TaxID=2664684 RepID=A0A7I8VKR3_9ANNE|nr:DgyrCDS5722 [Dimorphilus gyrociliatus]
MECYVFKFPPNSATPSLILGTKLTPGGDVKHFCKPSDVVTLSTGEFFIADGYCNSRIIKYSADGKVITQWGETPEPGEQLDKDGFPAPNKLLVPHSLAVNEDKKYLYIADREHGRITTFDFEGNFIFQTHPKEFSGTLYSVSYDKSAELIYAINGPSIYKALTAGGFTLSSTTGELLATWSPPQGFNRPHDIAVSKDGTSLYISEIGPNVIHKFQLNNSGIALPSHANHVSQQHNHAQPSYDKAKSDLNSFRDHPKHQPTFGTYSKNRNGNRFSDKTIRRKGHKNDNIDLLELILSDRKGQYKNLLDILANSEEVETLKTTYEDIMKELLGELKSQTAVVPLSELKSIANARNNTSTQKKLKKLLTILNGTEEETITLVGSIIDVVTHPLDKRSSTKTTDFITSSKPSIMKSEIKDDDMKASIIIGSLLLVPVIVIVIVVVILRLKRSGKISYIDATASFGKLNKNRRNFNIGQIFNRHKGFDRLSQEDGELDHLNSDSEVEDYSTTEQKA